MYLKKKITKYSTAIIMLIYIMTFWFPNKLVFAEETTIPIITLLGDQTEYVSTGSTYTDLGVVITDDKDTGLAATVTYTKDGSTALYFNTYEEANYVFHYNVTDLDGNKAAEVTRNVIVQTMEDKAIDDDYNIDGYEASLGFQLLSDENTRNLLAETESTPAAVKITRDENTLTAKLTKEDGSEFTTSAAVTYDWYRDDKLLQNGINNTYEISDDDIGNSIVVKVEQYNLQSEKFNINENYTQSTTPAAVEIIRDDDSLTAELINKDGSEFTTSAAITYDWYRDGELTQDGSDDAYIISDYDKGTDIIVKVDQYNLESDPFHIEEDESGITTPAAISVRITGTEKVGNILTGELLEDGSEVTTSSAVKYTWYRLSSNDSKNCELVGKDKTYKLVNGDQNKYIKLVISYEDELYEDITSKIKRRSSGNSSSSSSSSSSSTTGNDEATTTDDQNTIIDNSSAELAEGWNYDSKEWKYIKNGQVAKGWNQINGYWYLMDLNGIMLTGWQQVNGAWYLLMNNGAMATGWQEANGVWYLLKDDGAMLTGWQYVNGIWYLLKDNGAMATGWQQVNGTWYLLNIDGSMVTGWKQLDSIWYFFNSDESLAE